MPVFQRIKGLPSEQARENLLKFGPNLIFKPAPISFFEGRKFFDNLLKGVKYYFPVKSALIMIFLIPVIIGIPMPFAPIQIILLELFMDMAASAGFVVEPKNIYTRLPRNPGEAIFIFLATALVVGSLEVRKIIFSRG